MAIDRYLAEFLLSARERGADFRQVATLGRLNLFVDHRSLAALFREHGYRLSDQEIETMRTAEGGYAEGFLRHLGAQEIVSLDASGYEGAARIHDMNFPVPSDLKNRFSVVIDGGTLEHIFNFPTAIRNCMQMVRVGGRFFSQTMANNLMGHGFYQFSPELFFRVFSSDNGYGLRRMVVFEHCAGRPKWYQPADPRELGQRVVLVNGKHTLLMLEAERLCDVPIFSTIPQQSDYSAKWSHRTASDGEAGMHGQLSEWARSYRGLVQRYLPDWLYDLGVSAMLRVKMRRGFRRRMYMRLKSLRA